MMRFVRTFSCAVGAAARSGTPVVGTKEMVEASSPNCEANRPGG